MTKSHLGIAVLSGFAVAAALVLPLKSARSADAYPSHTIRMVIPTAPGSAVDLSARVLDEKLSELWGQPIVPEYDSGAGGTIGFDEVSKAPPDGYLMLYATSTMSTMPSLYKHISFDVVKGFTPISLASSQQVALVASPKFPGNSLADVIAMAKAQPGKLKIGSGGIGTTNDLAALLLEKLTGIKLLRVPYRGIPPAAVALQGGEIDLMFASLPEVLPRAQAGALKLIAISPTTSPAAPNLPAIAATVPGYDVMNWEAFFGPAKLPQPIRARWTEALTQAGADPQVKQRFATLGANLVLSPPGQLSSLLASDMTKWSALIRENNIPKQ